jgi:hypothetical protein
VENSQHIGERLLQLAAGLLDQALVYAPKLLGSVALLLAGWILAKLLRAISHRLLQWLDRLVERLLGEGRAARLRIGRSAAVLGNIVFWAVMLFFITASTQVLGLTTFATWLSGVLDHLPMLVAGLLIVIGGYFLSRFVADLILGASRLPIAQRAAAARSAQVAILAGALLVGADQIGIRVTFLAIFVGAIAAALAGGAIVAISAGARQHVANQIGARQVRQTFDVGQSIRIAGYEGRILEIGGQGVMLESSDGRVSLPGYLFTEQPVVLLIGPPEGSASARAG